MAYSLVYPEALKRELLNILISHKGRENAVGRADLVEMLKRRGVDVHERAMRECVKDLRRDGHLILSAAGENGGYYMAASQAEFLQFDQAEFGAKIADMNETRQAMKQAALRQWPNAMQQSMF